MWAYRMYEAWSEWRRDINENEREKSSVVKNILTLYLELHMMADVDLNEVLSQFMAEVRKDGGVRYPGKTLHEIISSLQRYLELKGQSVNIFSGLEFEKLRKSLDVEMKCSAKDNPQSLRPKQAEVIPVQVKSNLWEQDFFLYRES
jgi:hypothetical protein